MEIKASRLKKHVECEKRKLYKFVGDNIVPVKENQADGSIDIVLLKYYMQDDEEGYFSKEYIPEGMKKDGAKSLDITAFVINHDKKCIRWILYDMKGKLAGETTTVDICDKWNAGLDYIQTSVLNKLSDYKMESNLGVIAREYDRNRMKRLQEKYEGLCHEIDEKQSELPIAMRKRKTNISKYKAIYRASEMILNGKFLQQNGENTYDIHVKLLRHVTELVYQTELIV